MGSLILTNEKFFKRLFEIVPGAAVWIIILSPIWGAFWIPHYVGYFVIFFDVLWFYVSFTTAIFGAICFSKLKKEINFDWASLAKSLAKINKSKTHHIVLIPNYKEKFEKLDRALQSLINQDIGPKNLTVVLAMEEREGPQAKIRAKLLEAKFAKKFGNFFVTFHPLLPGEVAGKSSNQAYAAKFVKTKLIDEQGLPIEDFTITTTDADSVFHQKYFTALTAKFLTDEARFTKFWQPAHLDYNNFWQVPFPVRMVTTISNVSRLANSEDPTRPLFIYSVYSASLKMVASVDFWDVDVIPEDWHMFLKCFYKLGGVVSVEPIRIPVYFDAPFAGSFIKTLITRYLQNRRHAWGAVDLSYAVRQFFLHPEIPFLKKFARIAELARTHFVWSTHWFILTLGATIPTLINPVFAQTVAGHNLPTIARIILTTCLLALFAIILVDIKLRPVKPSYLPKWLGITNILQWFFLPVTTLLLSSLPGLDAHTRLMLGKRLEYQVTEKV